MTDQQADDKILELIKEQGQLDAGFRLLMNQYQERLYWHLRRMVTDHEDANDVLQNCLMKVYRGIERYKGEAKLYTWLYRIASNEAITFLNKRKRQQAQSIDEAVVVANQLKADSYFDGEQAQLILQQALSTLPTKQKAVFTMRYYDEMPYQQMSEVLGTSVGGLKASYHHAVKKIEEYLKNNHS